MRKTAVVVLIALAVASFASAQMMGRGPGMGMPGMPGQSSGMMGNSNFTMGAMHLTVAPDGTVSTVERRYDAATKTLTEKLIAYNATGTKAWTFDTTGGANAFEVAGAHVILSSGRTPLAGGSYTSELVALNLSDGKVAWRLKVDGVAMSIEPAPSQIYVLVVKPAGSATGFPGMIGGMMSGDRTLVAVNHSGVVLWSQPLGL